MSPREPQYRRPPWATGTKRESGRRRRRSVEHACPLCREERRMFWRCRCGFEMCQTCMDENLWGLTCNTVTWTCPDCGGQNTF
jgi:hypothetical protein